MGKIKTIECLKSLGPETLSDVIATLNVSHIVSDEDLKGLSSVLIENWCEKCDQFLCANGYTGGRLRHQGKYYSTSGAIYVVYDESQISYEEANEYMDDIARR